MKVFVLLYVDRVSNLGEFVALLFKRRSDSKWWELLYTPVHDSGSENSCQNISQPSHSSQQTQAKYIVEIK